MKLILISIRLVGDLQAVKPAMHETVLPIFLVRPMTLGNLTFFSVMNERIPHVPLGINGTMPAGCATSAAKV